MKEEGRMEGWRLKDGGREELLGREAGESGLIWFKERRDCSLWKGLESVEVLGSRERQRQHRESKGEGRRIINRVKRNVPAKLVFV